MGHYGNAARGQIQLGHSLLLDYAEAGDKLGQDNFHLRHGEAHAYADSWPGAERVVRDLVRGHSTIHEPVRIELVSIFAKKLLREKEIIEN